jgi:hypothetical protein
MATVKENTKLTMKSKVNIDDFIILISWVKSIFLLEGKKFNYQNLLDQAEKYKFTNTPLDTTIHPIDEVMIDAFKIYHKLKTTKERFGDVLEKIDLPALNVGKDIFMKETEKYEKIFEDLMENYRYEDPETRGIQKGVLTEKMNEYVVNEEYEKAAKVRDIIKEC